FGGRLASTVYSASGGGAEASREEGFGETGASDAAYPYLHPAPYLTRDPHPWTVQVALADAAARLGYAGQLTDAQVSATGPSGRALAITLTGAGGAKTVTGVTAARALGLRSTLFTIHLAAADAAPPAPND